MGLVSAQADNFISKAAAWQARIDLAAAHRLADRQGFSEGIFNHFTLAVPDMHDRYLQIPFGLHWSEVTASCLIEVGYDGRLLRGIGDVERSAFCIHAPIHRLLPSAACVLHTHMPFASALALTVDRALDTRLSQNAMRFHGRIAVDGAYNGLALDAGEGERIARAMGGADIAFLGNHGVVVCGARMAHAYDDLYYLERACMVQVLAQSTGRPLAPVDEHLARRVGEQAAGERLQSELFFEALRRSL